MNINRWNLIVLETYLTPLTHFSERCIELASFFVLFFVFIFCFLSAAVFCFNLEKMTEGSGLREMKPLSFLRETEIGNLDENLLNLFFQGVINAAHTLYLASNYPISTRLRTWHKLLKGGGVSADTHPLK